MGGGSEFPAELMTALLNGSGQNAAKEPVQKDVKMKHTQKDGKQGKDIKIKEPNSKAKEEKKEEYSKVNKEQWSNNAATCTEENRRQIQVKDKGEEKRKAKEDEKKKQKEVEVIGWEKNRTKVCGKGQDMEHLKEHDCQVEWSDEKELKEKVKGMEDHVKSVLKQRKELAKSEKKNVQREKEGKALENLEERIEVMDEKKNKECVRKGKTEKKDANIPEGEKNHGDNEILDDNLASNVKKDRKMDKGRYNVEKLKRKLSKLDAKMERIAAKSEIYTRKLKEAEKSSTSGGEIGDNDWKESNANGIANKVSFPSVPIVLKTDSQEMFTGLTSSKLQQNISEEILYPKLEEREMTGAGY